MLGTGINEGDAPENLTTAEFDRARLALFNGYTLLSRFKFQSNRLVFSTEQEILRVPASRGICCHVGGQIDFDGAGNLFLSTGDDTNPFQSAGYAPLDDRVTPQSGLRRPPHVREHERPARQAPADQGQRERQLHHPAGQPVPSGAGRHASRDLRDGLPQPVPLLGQPRQRATSTSATTRRTPRRRIPRAGPRASAGGCIVRRAANYGWPFCMTPSDAYVDYDFTPGRAAVRREVQLLRSRSTTRATTPACGSCRRSPSRTSGTRTTRARICSRSSSRTRAATASGRWAARRCSSTANISSPFRWPRAFEGQPIFYEWTRDYAKVFELNRPNGNRLADIHHLFGGAAAENPNVVLDNPMDMEFGPDNALYTLEYGTGLLRRAARGPARADRLRPRRAVHADRAGDRHAGVRDARPRSRSSSRARRRRTPTATG